MHHSKRISATKTVFLTIIASSFLLLSPLARCEESRTVLLLSSYGPDFAPYNFLTANLRNDLAMQYGGSIDYYDVSLASARYVDGGQDTAFVEYLRTLFREHRLDLIIAIGAPAARFVQRYRQELFPMTPMLLTAVEMRRVEVSNLSSNDSVVAFKLDLPALITNILNLLPETENVEVVIGNSPNEKFWLEELQREFAKFDSQVDFHWLNNLSLDEVLQRLSQTPPRTAILLGPFTVDGAGNALQGDRTLEKLYRRANAPIFSYVDAYFGNGVVGGPQISLADLSRRAAAIATGILRGEQQIGIVTEPTEFNAPTYDWRELQRWAIPESTLPARSTVEFRSRSVWERYRWVVLSAIVIPALQLFLMLGLLANRRRLRLEQAERHRAESEAQELSGRLIHAHEEERARLARELHDDVTQRLALLSIDTGQVERDTALTSRNVRLKAIREGLVRLSEDVHALSYRLHPSILVELGLADAIKSECERFSETCGADIVCDLDDLPKQFPKEAALSLFRIVQESLRNIARHANATVVKLSLRLKGAAVVLVIQDDGLGFDPLDAPKKKASLGQASMRQRMRHLGGDLSIESALGKGTIVRARLPLKEDFSEPSNGLVG